MAVFPITRENFLQKVRESQGVVVLDFWQPSCPACMRLKPQFEDLSGNPEYTRRGFQFYSVDVSSERRVAMLVKPPVMSLPMLVIFKNGIEKGRIGGQSLTIEAIEEELSIFLEP